MAAHAQSTHSVWNLTLAFELTSTFITSKSVPGSASSNVMVVRVPLPGVLIPPLPSVLPCLINAVGVSFGG